MKLVAARLPRTRRATRKRTYVWRQLRGLGAVYLQDGCCVLPRTADGEAGLAEAAAKVREFGGEATLSALAAAEDGWEDLAGTKRLPSTYTTTRC